MLARRRTEQRWESTRSFNKNTGILTEYVNWTVKRKQAWSILIQKIGRMLKMGWCPVEASIVLIYDCKEATRKLVCTMERLIASNETKMALQRLYYAWKASSVIKLQSSVRSWFRWLQSECHCFVAVRKIIPNTNIKLTDCIVYRVLDWRQLPNISREWSMRHWFSVTL